MRKMSFIKIVNNFNEITFSCPQLIHLDICKNKLNLLMTLKIPPIHSIFAIDNLIADVQAEISSVNFSSQFLIHFLKRSAKL